MRKEVIICDSCGLPDYEREIPHVSLKVELMVPICQITTSTPLLTKTWEDRNFRWDLCLACRIQLGKHLDAWLLTNSKK